MPPCEDGITIGYSFDHLSMSVLCVSAGPISLRSMRLMVMWPADEVPVPDLIARFRLDHTALLDGEHEIMQGTAKMGTDRLTIVGDNRYFHWFVFSLRLGHSQARSRAAKARSNPGALLAASTSVLLLNQRQEPTLLPGAQARRGRLAGTGIDQAIRRTRISSQVSSQALRKQAQGREPGARGTLYWPGMQSCDNMRDLQAIPC
jgi:hypothetical protein